VELAIDEALALALQLHKSAFLAGSPSGLARARAVYEKIVEALPDHPDALHYLGVLMHQIGETDRSLDLIRRAIAASPGRPEMFNNLGNVLKERGHLLEAAAAYQTAIDLGDAGADAESNLGAALKAAGHLDDAIAAFRRALDRDPSHAGAHNNLGNALVRSRNGREAITHFEKAIEHAPTLWPARQSLALALYHEGRTEEAIGALRAWSALQPNDPTASHMLSAFSQLDVPRRAADGFVRATFDALATSFDEHLRDLGYCAPQLVATALAKALPAPAGRLDVLDAGCGTGLCGPLLRPYASRLTGVDISGGMLAKARSVGAYDELVAAELTAFLRSSAGAYDVIACADTLCYFGDLTEVASAAASALRVRGIFVFTVERSDEVAEGYRLHPHGRYSHGEMYVREALANVGLVVKSVENAVLRLERGAPVAGLVVTVERS
jgi:predicted TPR repeat methyltransferase